jgi:uncharacterized membrane protein (DUF485 family)
VVPVTNAPNDVAARHDPVYDQMHASPEFTELRRRFRRFVFPATVGFLSWYLLYVVMSNWATGFMNKTIAGNINVALVFGLLQFLTTFLIAGVYARYMDNHLDPVARELERHYDTRGTR